MRIALLAHAPVLGGSTDLLIQVRDFFQHRGHVVQVIFGEDANPRDPRVEDAWILQSTENSWRKTMETYRKLVESFRPELAYSISGSRELDLFRFLRCVRIRHVSSLEQHGFADIPYWLTENREWFEAATANTPDAQAEIQSYTKRPTFLLPYKLPLPDAQSPAVEIPSGMESDRPIQVAYVSRFDRFQKRAHWLPEIIRRGKTDGLPLQWHLYGDGPEGDSLRKKLKSFPNVTFHGWIDRAKLDRQLRTHDLFFLCSRWEGLPIAMVEAMRCGLACVAPNIPAGIRWTLEHGGGWLYQAKSPKAAVAMLKEATGDRRLLLEKRRQALQLSTSLFAPALVQEQYLQLEAALKGLVFNGTVLSIDSAPRFEAIPLSGYFRRLAYAAEKTADSPGWLPARLARQLRVPR